MVRATLARSITVVDLLDHVMHKVDDLGTGVEQVHNIRNRKVYLPDFHE
jgi:hypothetical protein